MTDLLLHPTTGLPLSLVAGTINAPDPIPNDWTVQNQHNRHALEHLCRVIYDGGLSYIVRATDPPELDLAPDPFTDHAPGSDSPIVLLPADRDVESLSNPETDASDRAQVIRVIGTERQTVSGRPFLVQAEGEVPGTALYDYNGNPVERTRIVGDASVEYRTYAEALAADRATAEAKPPLTLNVKLSGRGTRDDCPPGDTIYAYHPASGLEDRSIVTTIDGQTVFPRGVQVFTRERSLGPSHYVKMRKSDGTYVQFPQPDGTTGDRLPGVIWSKEDATTLTVGDRRLEWQSDPRGLDAGRQYLADRATKPRP